jgi:hypothetical protein
MSRRRNGVKIRQEIPRGDRIEKFAANELGGWFRSTALGGSAATARAVYEALARYGSLPCNAPPI